ncbi:MAG: hypothetical protein HC884_04380 [Chloroflexaceae bacterium]|nr:hypothetical protein [Chloroflexaceae bacterium]
MSLLLLSWLDRVPGDVRQVVRERVGLLPFFGVILNFRRSVAVFAEWWPLVLPLLVWVGWRTYRGERREMLREQELRLGTHPPVRAKTRKIPETSGDRKAAKATKAHRIAIQRERLPPVA